MRQLYHIIEFSFIFNDAFSEFSAFIREKSQICAKIPFSFRVSWVKLCIHNWFLKIAQIENWNFSSNINQFKSNLHIFIFISFWKSFGWKINLVTTQVFDFWTTKLSILQKWLRAIFKLWHINLLDEQSYKFLTHNSKMLG